MKALATILLLLLAGLAAGCGSGDSGGEVDTTTTTSSDGEVEPSRPVSPGLRQLPGGGTEALGVLEYRDLEGGFWAVVAAREGEATSDSPVVAVLSNAEALGVDLGSLAGEYVRAEGKLLEGASIRMAGPEMEVKSLSSVAENQESG